VITLREAGIVAMRRSLKRPVPSLLFTALRSNRSDCPTVRLQRFPALRSNRVYSGDTSNPGVSRRIDARHLADQCPAEFGAGRVQGDP